jgi:hypothetical protein
VRAFVVGAARPTVCLSACPTAAAKRARGSQRRSRAAYRCDRRAPGNAGRTRAGLHDQVAPAASRNRRWPRRSAGGWRIRDAVAVRPADPRARSGGDHRRASTDPARPGSLYIFPNQRLLAGKSWKTSKVRLALQKNDELVIYTADDRALWASGSLGRDFYAIMQTNGALVVYTAQGEGVWSTGATGHAGAVLLLTSSGDVQILDRGKVVWSAGTAA